MLPTMVAGPQWRRAAAMVGLVGVLALPALRTDPPDGFPLSTYPMFASPAGATSRWRPRSASTPPAAPTGSTPP